MITELAMQSQHKIYSYVKKIVEKQTIQSIKYIALLLRASHKEHVADMSS